LLLPAARTAGEPATGTRGYDVLHYGLDLKLDPSARTVDGSVAIRLAAAQEALQRVLLDLSSRLTVDSTSWNGLTTAFVHEADSLVITLPQIVPADSVGTMLVHYHGRPWEQHVWGISAFGMRFSTHNAPNHGPPLGPVICTVGEPSFSHTWWPNKDHPHDKATADIALTVPDTLVAVSNGVLVEESTPEAGWRRFAWQENYPIATYLISVAASDYSVWHEECPGREQMVTLSYYVYPEDRQDAEYDLALTCDMLQFLEDLLSPYPFQGEKYGQAEIVYGGAMEHQTATSIGQTLITGDRRWETVFLHELAHHWFGNALTPATWPDIWLNEGFARYSEALWLEHRYGVAAYDSFMIEYGPGRHEELFRGEGTLSDPDPILNSLVYDKGAWVLHMLRDVIGDDVFFTFLRDYVTDPHLEFGNVTTPDLIDAVSAAAGFDTEPFFTPWLETDLVPELSIESHTLRGNDGYGVEVTVRQLQDPLFQIRLPIHLDSGAWHHAEAPLITEREHRFVWSAPDPNVAVTIDPEGRSLLRFRAAPPPLLRLLPAFPNPVGIEGADVPLVLRDNADVVCSLYDVRGRLVARWDLGPLSANDLVTPYLWHWDGADADGRPLPSGSYWLEMKSEPTRAVQQITLIR